MFSYPHYGTSPASFGRDASFLAQRNAQDPTPPSPSPSRDQLTSPLLHPHRQRSGSRVRRASRVSDLESTSELDEDLGASQVSSGNPVFADDDDDHGPGSECATPTKEPHSHAVAPQAVSLASAHYCAAPNGATRPREHSGTSGFSRLGENMPLLTAPLGTLDVLIDPEATTSLDPAGGELKRELGVLFKYSVPIIGTHLLEYSLLFVTVFSVGHLGTVELAASSLASMTSNVVALSIIIGFTAALDTLCPQAYTSPNPKLTSLFALRTLFILSVLFVPQFIIFWNMEPILLLLRQDPRVAFRASQYLRIISFGLPGYATFEVSRRWLQAQGLMLPPTFCVLIVAPLNALLNWLLVWGPDSIRIGFTGAPLATMISFNLMGGLCALYCALFAPKTAWGGFSRDVFRDLGPNLRLGLAGFAMVASEWWCWEIVGLASSMLGPTYLAAQSVVLTIASMLYQTPYAISAAAAVRCGNLLGAGKPRLARTATSAALVAALVASAFNVSLMIGLRNQWGRAFSSEEDVIEIVASVLPLVALFQVADATSGITGGLLRGAGKATVGALINLGGYYVVGLPLGLALTFSGAKMGLYGLWIGLTVALGMTSSICTIYLLRLDFALESVRARERIARGGSGARAAAATAATGSANQGSRGEGSGGYGATHNGSAQEPGS